MCRFTKPKALYINKKEKTKKQKAQKKKKKNCCRAVLAQCKHTKCTVPKHCARIGTFIKKKYKRKRKNKWKTEKKKKLL